MMHETKQIRMASWIYRCIEQWFEDIGEEVLEILDDSIGVIHIAEGETKEALTIGKVSLNTRGEVFESSRRH